MSSITNLKISGFRSYNPNTIQTIQFFKPLTLIWGKNGSGKTTIIQCLKFITTGALPPNSNQGKSFVMDPKVALKPQVIAQITLTCIASQTKYPVTAHRKVLLSSTNKGVKFQSKQQSVTIVNPQGKKLTVNHHCAQIQKQIPLILGISKPILENIVFCHQQQSLWPFSDSVTLKNIFDQLFQTERFSKYMQNLWQVHKQQSKRLRQLTVKIEYEKQNLENKIKNRKQHLKRLQNLQKQSQSIKLMKEKIQYLKKNINQNIQITKSREDILIKIGHLQNQLKVIQQQLKKSKQNYIELKFNPTKKYSKLAQIGFERYQQKLKFQEDKRKQIQIQVPIVNIEQAKTSLQEKQKQVQILKSEKEQILQTINQQKGKLEFNKKCMEIQIELKRVTEIYPHLKDNSQEHVLQSLNNKVKYMESILNSLEVFKRQIQSVQNQLKNISVIQPGLTQQEYKILKKDHNNLGIEINNIQYKIISTYKIMFKPVKNITYTGPSQLQKKISNIEAILKSKRQQLYKYQRMQKNKPQQRRQMMLKIQYMGIKAPQTNLHYSIQKKRCNFCTKPLNQQEIKQIQIRTNNIIKKSERALKDLKQAQFKEENYINPDIMIKKINQQIIELSKQRDILNSHIPHFQQFQNKAKQEELNKILKNQLEKCKFSEEQFNKTKVSPTADNLISVEQFKQLVGTYLVKNQKINNQRDKIIQYDRITSKNQSNNIKAKENIKKKQELKQSIQKTQCQLKYFQITKAMQKKLQQLLKSRKGKQSSTKKIETQRQRFKNIQTAQKELLQVSDSITKQELKIRQLAILIRYSHFSKQLKQKSKEMNELMRKLQKIDQKINVSKQKVNQLNRLNIEYHGQKSKIQNSVRQIQYSLNNNQDQNFFHLCALKQKALTKSIKDIQNLHKIIQISVNNYHQEKMMEINFILKQIWQEVYDGNDIEYIEITTSKDKDLENSKRKKLNLNYSIMMKKKTNIPVQDNTIQMKGKCSMGQKILASIIIRLALAQVFSVNNKILALDEPTTNLDRTHIKNLAKELGKLIQLGRQRNLQLILISHDIEFIQMLNDLQELTKLQLNQKVKYEIINVFQQINRNRKSLKILTQIKDIKQRKKAQLD